MKLPAILIAPALLLLTGCGKDPPPKKDHVRTIRAMKVGDIEVFAERSFPGRAEPYQEVDLAFRVSGPLETFVAKVGDEVKKDQIVATIQKRDFQVALDNAMGGLQRAEATRDRARIDLTRVENLQKNSPGAISEANVDQAREAFAVAKADVATFEASVKEAQNALDDTDLKAPFEGTIVATYVENFQNVRAQQMIVRLLDRTQIEFTAGIPETLISMAPYVQDITVIFDAFPDVEIPAQIVEIGREASSTTRTFPVTSRMTPPEGVEILPGMAGRGRGTPRPPGNEAELPIIIPVTAAHAPEADGGGYVWIIDPESNAVSRREVKLGDLTSTGYVIDEGLAKDEIIATAGVHFLKEGQVVSPEFQ